MIRFGIIGAGGIAGTHAKALQAIDDVELAGVYDIDSGKAEALAKQTDSQAFKSITDMEKVVDAVGIYTPPSTHREIALPLLNVKKHIFCEKPIAISVQDAEDMVECALKNNVKLMIGFNMRFREGYSRLNNFVKSGQSGASTSYFCRRLGMGAGSYGWGDNWRTDPKLVCGMTIESLSHEIDLIRWIMGDITTVYARTHNTIKELPQLDDNAYAVLTCKSGITATMCASWSSYVSENSRGIVGKNGTVIAGGKGIWNTEWVKMRTKDMPDEVIHLIHDPLDIQSYKKANESFIESIVSGKNLKIDGTDGLKALQISHALLESSRTKKPIDIEI